jgi:thiol-disulfide isomerase/thioredoxin
MKRARSSSPGPRASWALPALLAQLLVLVLATAPALAAPRTPGEVEVGQTLREAVLRGLNGPARKLSDYRGKPLIINVWASWCGPCREEMASLERLAWREPTGQFVVIGISTDDDADLARALLQRTHATLNHYIDRQLELEHMLGATNIPLTVLVDARGTVLEKVYGTRPWDSLESLRLIARVFRNPKLAPRP